MNNLNSDHTADNKNVYSSHIVLRDPDIMLIHLVSYFSALISIFWEWELTGFILIILAYLLLPHIFLPAFQVYLFSECKNRNFILQIQKKRESLDL